MTNRTTQEQRFVDLAAELAPALRRYVARRVSAGEIDDVMADVFLVLWRRLDDVPAQAALPWAYGVARNCLNNARRANRRQLELLDKVTRLDRPRHYAASESYEQLHDALRQLEEPERELLRLWAWEDLAPREIAIVMDLTPNAVSIRLTRARQKLAALLEPNPTRKSDAPSGHRPGEGSTP
ncbi:RNA polymerase sigma factor [Nocardioides sp.]|uniref:RNA polymerase sigma factor n=1 Tax=Nocardioides sp. TaxID=35761 RepID=UPI003D0EFB26